MRATKQQPAQIKLRLPRFRPDQWAIVQHPAKVKVLSMGRRWGKTILGGNLGLSTAAAGGAVAWIVPEYRNGRPLWRAAEAAVADLKKAGLVSVNRSERIIQFANGRNSIPGGFLGIYSMDNPDSIRGENFDLVILDEAAMMPPEAWTEAIEPVLADRDGDAVIISTPKGRNWFWEEWQRGQQDGVRQMSWKAPTSANPSPNIRMAAERARLKLSAETYRQEWLAEFLEGAGLVFRGISACAVAPYPVEPYRSTHVMGVDWAREKDYTVLVVMDVATQTVVDLDRFTGVNWSLQRGRLQAMAAKWQVEVILAEANSIGGPNIEALQGMGLPVVAFWTTGATKTPLIEDLSLAIETGALKFPPLPELVSELESYSFKKLPSGIVRYEAPSGLNDDIVISLALAHKASEMGVGYADSPW